jgi:hypothetical protein
MAAPVVVIFLAGALWQKAAAPGALACLWLAIFSIPFTLTKSILADANIHFLPSNLENPMVFAGAYELIAVVLMVVFSRYGSPGKRLGVVAMATVPILWLAAVSPSAIALLVLVVTVLGISCLMRSRRTAVLNLWDYSMLQTARSGPWYWNLWFWWCVMGAILVGIYIRFW